MTGKHLDVSQRPPTVEIFRAALVMNVRLPLWLEQPQTQRSDTIARTGALLRSYRRWPRQCPAGSSVSLFLSTTTVQVALTLILGAASRSNLPSHPNPLNILTGGRPELVLTH
jgi:hypothetical protein